jgi:hypothetical protein
MEWYRYANCPATSTMKYGKLVSRMWKTEINLKRVSCDVAQYSRATFIATAVRTSNRTQKLISLLVFVRGIL